MVSQAHSRTRGEDGTQEPDATPGIAEQDSDNCFRILLATDNHIGYNERDPVRGQDSINTFREILSIAREAEVDFVLLGGDLFHENRPSRTCIHQTIALLREYTLGDKPVSFELLSDPMDGSTPGFSFPAINYEDPNLNVAIPTFSIHGNHDDPQGTGPEGALCALDVLSVAGVINYFGRIDLSPEEAPTDGPDQGIRIKPILLRKGTTHLALYGLGNVKDNRLHYELRSNRVKMYMPEGGDVAEEDWFNMLLVHQNRVKHGPQSSVPEGMFDDSIKLVLWGHEHDCRIWPEKVEGKDYYITQPGSSVATSLAPGEALPKHVGILSIQGSQFQITEIPLKTVRPFELDEVVLTEAAADETNKINLGDRDSIAVYLRKQVEELIRRAKLNWAERHQDDTEPVEMMLPLIRLKVETTDAKEMTNPVRFGQDFVGRVANPRDILQYYRRKKATEKKAKNLPDAPDAEDDDWDADPGDPNAMTASERLSRLRMSNLVKQYLQAQNLEVLVENGMEDAVMRFVEKEDKDAIKDFVAETLKSVGRDMKGQEVAEEDVEEHMLRAKEHAATQWAANHDRAESEVPKTKKGKTRAESVDSLVDDGDSMMDVDSDASFKAASKGKAKGKTNGAAKKGGKKALFEEPPSDDEEEEEEEEDPRPSAKTKKLTPANVRATKAAPKRATASGSKGKGGQQTQLTFSKAKSKPAFIELSDDE